MGTCSPSTRWRPSPHWCTTPTSRSARGPTTPQPHPGPASPRWFSGDFREVLKQGRPRRLRGLLRGGGVDWALSDEPSIRAFDGETLGRLAELEHRRWAVNQRGQRRHRATSGPPPGVSSTRGRGATTSDIVRSLPAIPQRRGHRGGVGLSRAAPPARREAPPWRRRSPERSRTPAARLGERGAPRIAPPTEIPGRHAGAAARPRLVGERDPGGIRLTSSASSPGTPTSTGRVRLSYIHANPPWAVAVAMTRSISRRTRDLSPPGRYQPRSSTRPSMG